VSFITARCSTPPSYYIMYFVTDDPRFENMSELWSAGRYLNLHSDELLINLLELGETGGCLYKIYWHKGSSFSAHIGERRVADKYVLDTSRVK